MYRFSKFLILIVLLMFSVSAMSQSGIFYNQDRKGEGIFVTIDKERAVLGFALFTYWDAVISVPPVFSPPKPPTPTLWTTCETFDFDGQPIPPVFSPKPPEAEAVTYKGGAQAWFIGTGTYIDNIAIGDLYTNKAANYPQVTPTIGISQQFKVGTFLIEGYEGGFDLYIDCNDLMPTSLYMCNNVLSFDTLLIGNQ